MELETIEVAGISHRYLHILGTAEASRVEMDGTWCVANSDAKKNMLIGHAVISLPESQGFFSRIFK